MCSGLHAGYELTAPRCGMDLSFKPPMQAHPQKIYVGTAGWTIPTQAKGGFPAEGSHLSRYAQVFNAVEINSAFYRDHKPETYLKWAEVVPADFRFAVKLNRYFTQEKRLTETGTRLTDVLNGLSQLGPKLGVLLVQLPPSLTFERAHAHTFFSELRKRYAGSLALEPRHLTWATPEALALVEQFKLGKVAADPERCPQPDPQSAGCRDLLYMRLHGSPEIYKSRYTPELVDETAQLLKAAPALAWCIFDNTTFGYATENALELYARIKDYHLGENTKVA